jgi:hypothetical protein
MKLMVLFLSITPSMTQPVFEGLFYRDSGKFKRTQKLGDQASGKSGDGAPLNVSKPKGSFWGWDSIVLGSLSIIVFSNFLGFAFILHFYLRSEIHWKAIYYFPWLIFFTLSGFIALWTQFGKPLHGRVSRLRKPSTIIFITVCLIVVYVLLNSFLGFAQHKEKPFLDSPEICEKIMKDNLYSQVTPLGAGCDKCSLMLAAGNVSTVLKFGNTAKQGEDAEYACQISGNHRIHFRQEVFWTRFFHGQKEFPTLNAVCEGTGEQMTPTSNGFVKHLVEELEPSKGGLEETCNRYVGGQLTGGSSYFIGVSATKGKIGGIEVANCTNLPKLMENVLNLWASFTSNTLGQLVLTDMHYKQILLDTDCSVGLVDIDSIYALADKEIPCPKLPTLPCSDPGCHDDIYGCIHDPNAYWKFQAKYFAVWWLLLRLGSAPPLHYRALSIISKVDPRVNDETSDVVLDKTLLPRFLPATFTTVNSSLYFCDRVKVSAMVTGFQPYIDLTIAHKECTANYTFIRNIHMCSIKEISALLALPSNVKIGIVLPNLFGMYFDVPSLFSEFGRMMNPPIEVFVALAEPWRMIMQEFLFSSIANRPSTCIDNHVYDKLKPLHPSTPHLDLSELWRSHFFDQRLEDPFEPLTTRHRPFTEFHHFTKYPRTHAGFKDFIAHTLHKLDKCLQDLSRSDPYLKDNTAYRYCYLSLDYTGLRSIRMIFSKILGLDWWYGIDSFPNQNIHEFRYKMESCVTRFFEEPENPNYSQCLKTFVDTDPIGRAAETLLNLTLSSEAFNDLHVATWGSFCRSFLLKQSNPDPSHGLTC